MESNKLIAEFMGAIGTPKYNPTEWDIYITGCIDVDSDDENAKHFYTPEEMKYHSEWNWLMPVVEKIEATLDDDGYGNNVLIETSSCTILSGNDGSVVIGFTEGITKTEATYQAVVEFINQYNFNKGLKWKLWKEKN